MKKIFVILCMCFSLCSFTLIEHESYLSVTEIEYKDEAKSLQIISRVFIDDLEDVLTKRYQKEINLSDEKDLEVYKPLIEKYFHKKLNVATDGKQLDLIMLGSKFDADQVIVFIEGVNVEKFKNIKIENLILTDLFDSQKNIVHMKKGDALESMLLVKGNSSKTLYF